MFWKWLCWKRPSRTIEASQRAQNRLQDSIRWLKRMEKKHLKLEQASVRLVSYAAAHVERARAVSEETAEGMKTARQAVEQAEQAMGLLRTEHEVDGVTIESLTSSIKEYQALSEANIAMSNHRRGQMAPGGPEQL